jgi:2-iminoacetate synthase ThiH
VTTAGYLATGYEANDGAVIEVVPWEWRPNRTAVQPLAQRLMAFDPLRMIPKHRAYLGEWLVSLPYNCYVTVTLLDMALEGACVVAQSLVTFIPKHRTYFSE